MYFQELLGIDPSSYLRHPDVDAFFDANAVPDTDFEDAAIKATGMASSLLRMLTSIFLLIPVNLVLRFVPTTSGRHIYALVTGLALLYFPFGNQIVYILALCALNYIVMLAAPQQAGRISWVMTFTLLLLWMERAGSLWATGAVDISGALMVATLKLIAISCNVSDGYSARSSPSGKKPSESADHATERSTSAPSPLHFMSYIFASGNLLVGPFFEYSDYIRYMQHKGAWADAFGPGMLKSATAAAGKALALSLATLGVYQGVAAVVTEDAMRAPQVWELSIWARYGIPFALGLAKRCSYYFVWFASEAALNISGFGFSGFDSESADSAASSKRGAAKYDRYNNVEIIAVETCTSMAAVPRYWNKNTGVFLRYYVYEPLGGGFPGLLFTQLVSGIWHGLREGYVAFFFMSTFLFQGSKVIYKQERRLPPQVLQSPPYVAFKWLISHVQLNVFCIPFMLQDWNSFMPAWQSVYFAPHMFAFAVCALGALVPPPRKAQRKTKHNDSSTEELPKVEAKKVL